MRIFYGLNITSRVAISKVVLRIRPYNKNWDALGILSDAEPKEYAALPVKVKFRFAEMEVVAPASMTEGKPDFTEWNKLLEYIAYKLDLPITMPHACPLFTNDQYQRTLSVYVVDRYGRYSNMISRRLKVITCK